MALTKKERKKERKLQRQLENQQRRKELERKKTIKNYATIAIVLFIIVLGSYFLFFKQPDVTGKGVLRISQDEVVLGSVSVKGGIVTKEISLINIGDGDLTLTGLDSSCGCTSASVINNEVESPVFQMGSHGRNPTDWKTIIPPGETATLKIIYDPATHPNLRGPVTRIVSIFSNSPGNGAETINVRVNQVD